MAEQLKPSEQPDYSTFSDRALSRAINREAIRTTFIDAGYGTISMGLLAKQLFLHLLGFQEAPISQPDPRGVSRRLDAMEQRSLANKQAIRSELSRRTGAL